MNSWYLLAAIPVFGILVLAHEFGHFITAKWAGIRVEEFSIGFPPRVVGIRKRDKGGWEVIWFGGGNKQEYASAEEAEGALSSSASKSRSTDGKQSPFTGTSGGVSTFGAEQSDHTLYSISLLPIGGFVRMPGENGDAYDPDGNYDPKSFAAKPAGKRIIVLLAGVVMNVLLAMILYTVAYSLGEPTISDKAVVGTVVANSPAAQAGLRPDDLIVSINSQPVKQFSDVHTVLDNVVKDDKNTSANATHPVVLGIQRAGVAGITDVTVNARLNPPSGQGRMGIGAKVVLTSYPLWQAPFRGIVHTYEVTRDFLGAIGQMIVGAIKPEFAGPVGIVKITGEVAQSVPDYGLWPILSLTAVLSLNLAIVNILPFPALDGGRILLILIELLRGGKRLKPEREGLINFIGLAILLALMVIITISDVSHWGS